MNLCGTLLMVYVDVIIIFSFNFLNSNGFCLVVEAFGKVKCLTYNFINMHYVH